MQNFELYNEAWMVYIACGILLVFLIDYKLKKGNFFVRVGLGSLIAVGAFTPQTVMDADSLAPLILSSVLNAEVQGVEAIYSGLFTLVIIWGIVMTVILAIKYFVDARKGKANTHADNHSSISNTQES